MRVVDEFTLAVPGDPRGQGRPRIGRARNGRPVAFTDAKTRTYAQIVQGEWIAAERPTLLPGAWELAVVARMARPGGHYRSDGRTLGAAGLRAPWPTRKPDLSNVVKLIEDALVAVGAVPDDALCVAVHAHKVWADHFAAVGVEVRALSVPLPESAREAVPANEGPAAAQRPGPGRTSTEEVTP